KNIIKMKSGRNSRSEANFTSRAIGQRKMKMAISGLKDEMTILSSAQAIRLDHLKSKMCSSNIRQCKNVRSSAALMKYADKSSKPLSYCGKRLKTKQR